MAREPKPADYKYVDTYYCKENGQSSEWKRMEVNDVAKWQMQEAMNFNCFATVQRFANPDRGDKGEAFTAPLYFDLDYEQDPAVSQADAVKLIQFFTDDLGVKESDLWIFFSGSKGFHVLISSVTLDIQPRADLHKVFKNIAGYLVHRLDLKALDLVVYTNKRMLRLPNSVHQKTKLFKIELSLSELKNLTIDEIREMASSPRQQPPIPPEQRSSSIKLRERAANFYRDKAEEYTQAATTSSREVAKDSYDFRKGVMPICVQEIYEGGWKKDGDRNQATVQLACYMKDAGYTKAEAESMLLDWVVKHTSANSKYQKQQRIANTRSVVDAVYSKDNEYRFSAPAILALHEKEKRGPYAKDLLQYRKATEDELDIHDLHLIETGNAEYTGKLIRTRVMVVGKRSTPYIVPQQIEYRCWGLDKCRKNGCTLYHMPERTAIATLNVKNRELIQMAGIGDDNVKAILKQVSGFTRKCAGYSYDVIGTTNIEELLVIPMAETNEQEDSTSSYVLRKVYAIGGLDLQENKYYEITGYVISHPKNMEATIMVSEAKPLQDVVDRFELTDEVKEQLAVFQPKDHTMQSIHKKLTAICNDLAYNVTRIVERDDVTLAILLTYHSVLRFRVPWDTQPIRGWVETKVIGDTGTAKSSLISAIQQYASVGTRVNAESTSRTGLTYKMEQSGSGGAWYIVWGAWPLADRELIWIDEDTGISKTEYGEMTLARSDGRLEVKRAVTAETLCRVRAILSGNAPAGKRLADYGQGVEALKDVFNNEDIRRFDMAVFMRASDVDPEVYNQQLPTYPNGVTSEALKNNVLFAWSRHAEDVLFAAGTIEKILETATNLSKIYGNATDIPLVSPSDQRNKIARLAVALAALTHSVDETGERLQVWPGHVEYVEAFLRAIYNAPGCGLNYYAKLAIREEEMNDERYEKITKELKSLDFLKEDLRFYEFMRLFAHQRYIRLGDVEAMLAIDKDEAKALVNMLTKMRMIVITSGGYRKTPRFNAYVRKNFELGLFDGMDDEY